jgi:hypothetical protein
METRIIKAQCSTPSRNQNRSLTLPSNLEGRVVTPQLLNSCKTVIAISSKSAKPLTKPAETVQKLAQNPHQLNGT